MGWEEFQTACLSFRNGEEWREIRGSKEVSLLNVERRNNFRVDHSWISLLLTMLEPQTLASRCCLCQDDLMAMRSE